jgi:hypothetical protein
MKDCVEMLQDIDEYGEGLTTWETKFISDMMGKKSAPIVFSVNEMRKIREIHERVVPEAWK